MFVMTMTKRRLLRVIMFALVLLTGIAIGVFAILSSIDTGAAGIKLPIYSAERADNRIAVTFDCAWGNSNTSQLLSILDEHKAKATFFVSGEFCDNYPDDVKMMYGAGHEIGNHSDKHPHVVGMNINDLVADTKECSRKIEMITGRKPTLYRTPYGEYDDTVITAISGMGMQVIQWNTDSIDWDKPDAATIIERTTRNIASGSILLFHNDLENTTRALPDVLKSLKEQGFELCTVSEVVYKDNYTVDANGRQQPLKDTSAAIVFSEDEGVNSAFKALAENLTAADVDKLESEGMSVEMAEKTAAFLTDAQIAALQTQSYEQLLASFAKLKEAVYAKEYGDNDSTDSAVSITEGDKDGDGYSVIEGDKDGDGSESYASDGAANNADPDNDGMGAAENGDSTENESAAENGDSVVTPESTEDADSTDSTGSAGSTDITDSADNAQTSAPPPIIAETPAPQESSVPQTDSTMDKELYVPQTDESKDI